MLRTLFIFTLMAMAGMVAGRIVSGKFRTSDPDLKAASQTARTTSRPEPDSFPVPTDELLQRMRKTLEEDQSPFSSMEAEIANWSTPEIQRTLEEMLSDTHFLLNIGQGSMAARALMTAWIQRDCETAAAWLVAVENPLSFRKLAVIAADAWPDEKAEQCMQLVLSNKELFNGPLAQPFLAKALQQRANDGPDSVIRLLNEAREAGVLILKPAVNLPENFDFAALAGHPGFPQEIGKSPASDLLLNWAKHDPAAAYDWLLAHKGAASLAVLLNDAEEKTPDWLATRYHELDPAERREFLARGFDESTDSRRTSITQFIAALPDPEDALAVRSVGVQLLFRGDLDQGLDLLNQIKDPDLKIRILEEAVPDTLFFSRNLSGKLPQGDIMSIRRELREWHADEEQVERILKKFTP